MYLPAFWLKSSAVSRGQIYFCAVHILWNWGMWVGSPRAPFSPGLSLLHTISLSHPQFFLERTHVGNEGQNYPPWPQSAPTSAYAGLLPACETSAWTSQDNTVPPGPQGICGAPNASNVHNPSPLVGYPLLASWSYTHLAFFSLTPKPFCSALWKSYYKVKIKWLSYIIHLFPEGFLHILF